MSAGKPRLARPTRPVQPVRAPGQRRETPTEVTFGNVKVSRSGIEFIDGTTNHPTTVDIDQLTFGKELGKGAQGSVALYVDKSDAARRYAVKSINLVGRSQTDVQKVAAEIRNIFTQRSAYVVSLHNAFLRDGRLLLVMEFMDWGNMEELQEVRKQLPEAAASYIASQLLHSLALLHTRHHQVDVDADRRQIHRDIKPANLLISKDGSVKLADFGVAASAETVGVASFVGTATYMSPERIKGQRYGTASDVWSVGIVVTQALLGRYPFDAASLGFMALLKAVTTTEHIDLGEGFSADAQSFVDACLQQEERDRPSADTLLQHPWITQHNGTSETPLSTGREALIALLSSIGDATMRDLPASAGGEPRADQPK